VRAGIGKVRLHHAQPASRENRAVANHQLPRFFLPSCLYPTLFSSMEHTLSYTPAAASTYLHILLRFLSVVPRLASSGPLPCLSGVTVYVPVFMLNGPLRS